MATYKKCDRCGDSDEKMKWLDIININVEVQDEPGYSKDLCQSCRRKLKEFFEPLPQIAQPMKAEETDDIPF